MPVPTAHLLEDGRAGDAPHPAGDPTVAPGPWTSADTAWSITLFGTAVGAGILFLPLSAGAGGLLPLLLGTLLAGPMVYLSHRALSRVICASPRQGHDVTELLGHYFGARTGLAMTVLYWLCFYPIVLIYAVSLTNTVDSFLVNQIGVTPPPRWLLAALLVGLLMAVVLGSQRVMLVITQAVVYPLIALLAAAALLLVPHWSLDGLTTLPSPGDAALSLWLMVPVLVFAFNHAAAISQFSLAMQREHGHRSAAKASVVLQRTTALLVVFTMGFVWSCVLALGPQGLDAATDANLPVLSYLANELDSPFFSWAGPLVSIAAIVSSFFGHYLGAAEGGKGLLRAATADRLPESALHWGIAALYGVTAWLAAVANPTVLDLIEKLSGPVMAAFIFFMPMLAIATVPALRGFRGRWGNVFVVAMGVVAVSALAASLVRDLA